jgi:hypothetical protein
MKRIMLSILTLALFCTPTIRSQQPQKQTDEVDTSNMPSNEEIDDLLSKASEYVTTYKATFRNAAPTLDKAPTPGFVEKSDELCSQANLTISAIKKNGMTAYALVALVGVLDDMSLNAAKASSIVVIVGLQQSTPESKRRAGQDMLDLAQAGKNCYDISELLLHSTLRLIAVEEAILHKMVNSQK